MLEAFLAGFAHVVGEIAVQRRYEVAHLRIDGEMKTFDRIGPPRDSTERFVELRHVVEFELDVELPECRMPEPELASRKAEMLENTLLLQRAEVRLHGIGELEVVDASRRSHQM